MDVERVFQKLRPVMGARLDELWQAYLLSDPKTRALLEASLRAQLATLGSTFEDAEILLTPPPAEKAAGEIPLGGANNGTTTPFCGSLPNLAHTAV